MNANAPNRLATANPRPPPTNSRKTALQTATIFNRETVPLDGERFADCEFQSCRMVYAGGEPPHFNSCQFKDCEWLFDEAAARTLKHLRLIWTLGGKAPVQALIKEITAAGR